MRRACPTEVGTVPRGRTAGRSAGVTGRAFTLVELLTVMVIMGVLLGIAIPAFEKLTVGTGVDAAARMVGAQMRLARDFAISHRQRVAIIMPQNLGALSGTGYAYTCFRPAIVSRSGSDYVFDRWVENTNWSFLPAGTSIMEADDDIGIADGGGNYQADPKDNNYTVVDDVPLDPLASSTVDDVRAVIFAPAGRVLNTAPAWVTVGDSVYTSAGSWTVRNPANDTYNKSCANQMSIVADGYTGRAIQKTPADYGN